MVRIGPGRSPSNIREVITKVQQEKGIAKNLATDAAAKTMIGQRVQAGFGKYPPLKGRVQTGFKSGMEEKIKGEGS